MIKPITDEMIQRATKFIRQGYSVRLVAKYFGVGAPRLSTQIRIAEGAKHITLLKTHPTKAQWANRNPLNDISSEEIQNHARRQHTFEDIGRTYGISKQRARQILVTKGVDYFSIRRQYRIKTQQACAKEFPFQNYSLFYREIIKKLEGGNLIVTKRKRVPTRILPSLTINGKRVLLSATKGSRKYNNMFNSRHYKFNVSPPYDDFDYFVVYTKELFLIIPSEDIKNNRIHRQQDSHIYVKDCRYGNHDYRDKGKSEGRLCSCKYENRFDFLKEKKA